MKPYIKREIPDADLFRWYGVAALFFSLKLFVSAYQRLPEALELSSAWPLYGFTLVSGWIVVRGPGLITLGLAGASALRCLISNGIPEELLLSFPAAEWALFVALPWFTLLGCLLSSSDDAVSDSSDAISDSSDAVSDSSDAVSDSSDAISDSSDAVSSVSKSALNITQLTFRLALLGTMSWAALHKLNADFFNERVSCVRLSESLTTWWGVPQALYAWISPSAVIIAEGGLGLLLWWRPRLGVLFALGMFAHFGSIGATALATLAITMSLAFLSTADRAALYRGLYAKRIGASLLCALLITGSWLAYQGPWSWPQYGVFQAMIGVITLGVGALTLRQGVGERARLIPSSRRGRLGLLAMVMVWGINGASPYLGVKFQYSFSMLSNLRVDDARWNSLIVPRSLRLTRFDDHVHVREVMYRSSTGRVLRGGPLRPGLYTPHRIKLYIESAQEVGETITLNATYHGEDHQLMLRPPQALISWLETLPSSWHLQDKLSASGPQRCVH